MTKLANRKNVPEIENRFEGKETEIIWSIFDKKSKIRYDDKHTKVMPKVKLRVLLGLIICHKKGMPNNKIGYAVMPWVLFTIVNQ